MIACIIIHKTLSESVAIPRIGRTACVIWKTHRYTKQYMQLYCQSRTIVATTENNSLHMGSMKKWVLELCKQRADLLSVISLYTKGYSDKGPLIRKARKFKIHLTPFVIFDNLANMCYLVIHSLCSVIDPPFSTSEYHLSAGSSVFKAYSPCYRI